MIGGAKSWQVLSHHEISSVVVQNPSPLLAINSSLSVLFFGYAVSNWASTF